VTTKAKATTSYPMTPRNRVKRLHERGSYDRAKIHALLDASMLCHVSYVVDGQPYCTPTFFWREGEHAVLARQQREPHVAQPV
jgi:nitroimidazol reductase NimA-like FMN-containing flavoprotein (pyridoxamine 5'-phosphate oxidase superfamily)